MGCKESKHKAVAVGNTIITPSSSRKSMSRGQNASIKNSVPSLQRSRSTRSTPKKKDSLKKINVGDSKASNVLKGIENSGYGKGTVNVSKVLENEDRRLKELNDRNVKDNEKVLIKENNDVGVEANIENAENAENLENVENAEEEKEKESILIPKEDLSSSSRKFGESIEALITDGLSGTSVYYTPTEVTGPFSIHRKTDNDEEKQESTEEIKDTKTEEAAEEDPTKTVNATPVNHVQEAEFAEKDPIKNDDATPRNQVHQAEVAEKLKAAEAAIAALETLVKETDKGDANYAAIQNPVEGAEEVPVTEAEVSDETLEKPVIEADVSEEIRAIEAESTDATLQNPVQEADKSEDITEIEAKETDAALPHPVIESDKDEETLLNKDEEAVENEVKEIHEVADKVKEIPVKETETTDATDHENKELVSDKTEDVKAKEAEGAYTTSEDPVKEVEVADKLTNLMTEAEAASIDEDNPVKKLENMTKVETKDKANKKEDTKNSSTANAHQKSTEDPDN